MRIGILGTGNLATALATGWARAGHHITIGGRSTAAADAIANRIGGTARPVPAVAAGADAVLLAVRWDGVTEMLTAAAASNPGRGRERPDNPCAGSRLRAGQALPPPAPAEGVSATEPHLRPGRGPRDADLVAARPKWTAVALSASGQRLSAR
jgi:hypothetical protein